MFSGNYARKSIKTVSALKEHRLSLIREKNKKNIEESNEFRGELGINSTELYLKH